jgi:signal transduction histidine kinase
VELNSLIRVSKAILDNGSFKDSANLILNESVALIGNKAGYLSILDQSSSQDVVFVFAPKEKMSDLVFTSPIPITGMLGTAYGDMKTLIDNSPSASAYLRFLTAEDEVKNLLLAPITVQSKTIGLLGFEGKDGGFSENDALLASIFSVFAGIAFENNRKLDQIKAGEEQIRRLETDLEIKGETPALLFTQKQLWEEIGRVCSELAHDMRGPLQTITNSVFLIERKPNDLNVYLPKINGALTHASTLLDSFREYYRGHELTLITGNINRVIEKGLEDIQVPDSVKVVKKFDESITDTVLDPVKMRRVFWNLAKNGVEAMPNGGTLTLESSMSGNNIIVTISDTGTGISENIQPKVFVAFGAKKRGGFGLGTAVSKRVIEAHGGQISFETEPGKGTVFTVVIPKKSA